MCPPESTKPVDIEALKSPKPFWQTAQEVWSFQQSAPVRVPRRSADRLLNPWSANYLTGPGTSGLPPPPRTSSDQMRRKVERPRDPLPVVRFGKRSFRPLYHWEGVVETVSEEGFYARLVPFERGRANRAKVEYSEFFFDDLAEETDLDLVEEGAAFYWTIGKRRDRAGTLQNTSLVRFRRVPAAGHEQTRVARARALELLDGLRSNQ